MAATATGRRKAKGSRRQGRQIGSTGRAVRLQGLQAKAIRPALGAVGLPARACNLRHTFAALQLTAGVHFMQVSKWLGHSDYLITMSVYADYIPDEDAANPLPEPVAPAKPAEARSNVLKLLGRQTS